MSDQGREQRHQYFSEGFFFWKGKTQAMTPTPDNVSEALRELFDDLGRWDRMSFGSTKQAQDGAKLVKEAVRARLKPILASLSARTSTAPVAWQWSREGTNGTEWVVVHDQAMATACQQLFDNKGTGQKVQALYASPPPPQPGVTVKPLEWIGPHSASDTLCRAECLIGTYRVWTYHGAPEGRWFWHLSGIVDGGAANEDDAKAAAQADYETRIRSALEVQPGVTVTEDEAADALWEELLPHMQVGTGNAYQDKVRALEIIRAALAASIPQEEGE